MEIQGRNTMDIKKEMLETKKQLREMKEQSFAMELLSDFKKQNKRLFIILTIVLVMWFVTIGYLVYVLNDVGTIETKTAKQWCEEYGISQTTFCDRLKRGWTLEQALTIPTKGLHQKVFKETS